MPKPQNFTANFADEMKLSKAERKTVAIRHVWLPIIGTLVVGVSLGLPLVLYMRQRVLDATTV